MFVPCRTSKISGLDGFVRRCREGCEFFKSWHRRKQDLAAAKAAAA
jgi:hypothetical protein